MCLPLVVGAVAGYAATTAAVTAGMVAAGTFAATVVGVAAGAIAGGVTAKLQGDDFTDGAKMGALGGLGGSMIHAATYTAPMSTSSGAGSMVFNAEGQLVPAATSTAFSPMSTASEAGSLVFNAQGQLVPEAVSTAFSPTSVGSGSVMQSGTTNAGQGLFGKAAGFLKDNQVVTYGAMQLGGSAIQGMGEGAAMDKKAEEEAKAKAERRLTMSQSASGRADRLRSEKRRQAGTGSDVLDTPPPAVINKQYDEVATA